MLKKPAPTRFIQKQNSKKSFQLYESEKQNISLENTALPNDRLAPNPPHKQSQHSQRNQSNPHPKHAHNQSHISANPLRRHHQQLQQQLQTSASTLCQSGYLQDPRHPPGTNHQVFQTNPELLKSTSRSIQSRASVRSSNSNSNNQTMNTNRTMEYINELECKVILLEKQLKTVSNENSYMKLICQKQQQKIELLSNKLQEVELRIQQLQSQQQTINYRPEIHNLTFEDSKSNFATHANTGQLTLMSHTSGLTPNELLLREEFESQVEQLRQEKERMSDMLQELTEEHKKELGECMGEKINLEQGIRKLQEEVSKLRIQVRELEEELFEKRNIEKKYKMALKELEAREEESQ